MRACLLALGLMFVLPASSGAQAPVSALSDLWMRVRSGDRVFVADASGVETEGIFGRVSDSALTLVVNGQPRDIPSASVREISKAGDSLKNGFLIGAAIGGGLWGLAAATCDDTYDACDNAAATVVGGALVWGGLGMLVDHFVKGRTVVFRVGATSVRLTPTVSVDRGAVRLSLNVPLARQR